MRLSQIIPPKADTHFDVVLVGGMLDLAHLKVLRPDLPPILLYLHENQFAYPLSPGEKIDFRYGLVDVMNILASGKAAFNSSYNRNSLIMECRNLFRRLPDAIPRDIPAKLEEKSTVLYPGIAPTTCTQDRTTRHPERKIPLVIWNHRHEHDKNPEAAFDALIRLSRRSVPFELAILGENFSDEPEAFNRARQHLRKHIVFDGYPERIRYNEWLDKGSVVISTARQENFGLSVIEAAAAGCWPLVPRRLAYPEVMPEWVSGACFWDDEPSLDVKLEMILRLSGTERRKLTAPLSSWLKTYEWTVRAPSHRRCSGRSSLRKFFSLQSFHGPARISPDFSIRILFQRLQDTFSFRRGQGFESLGHLDPDVPVGIPGRQNDASVCRFSRDFSQEFGRIPPDLRLTMIQPSDEQLNKAGSGENIGQKRLE
jgi:glycosyltransferase involved in cell wall biosynthesis